MIQKSLLKTILLDQQQTYRLPENYIPRNIEQLFLVNEHTEISIITGLRRVGKSTLLLTLKQKFGGDYFVNFDDERLTDFQVSDFQILEEVFLELFGKQDVFYFDEIQNITGWERFIRRLYDMGKRIFITGSNANLLSADLGTHLTGRYISYSLYPLSFQEFLKFNKIQLDISCLTTEGKVQLLRYFNEYMKIGGIPKFVLSRNPLYLQQLVQDVIYRDVVRKYVVKYVNSIDKLARYAFSNYSRLINIRKTTSIIGVKSHPTVSQYLNYLEQAYLLFTIPKYTYSLKHQYLSPKKLYVIDLALAKQYGFAFSDDLGYALENTVFLQLKRQNTGQIFYFSDDAHECDFVIHREGRVVQLIQVTHELTDANKHREIKGLVRAMKHFGLKEGLIITSEQEKDLKVDGFIIKVLPIYKWMLEGK